MKTKYRILISILLLAVVVGGVVYFFTANSYAPYFPNASSGEVNGEVSPILDFARGEEEHVEKLFQVEELIHREFRGIWVTSVINLDFPTSQGITAQAMKAEIDTIINRTEELGLNVIIFQVRPTGDAFYESDIFPWSHWLSGEQGVPIEGFDPLAYFIEQSHARNIELHAWINPYRIIHTIQNSSDPNSLYANHPVRLRPELAVAWTDPSNGRQWLFLDPGLPQARQLIIDGIESLIRRYNVDGIHFDDYFYPSREFNDDATFARYGGDMDLHDWRRENVNTLVRDIQTRIRELNEELDRNVAWGISPTAIWKNQSSDPLGIPTTRGQESYHALYADTRLWVTEGWLDYIMPQIYWYIGFEIADFEAVFRWWEDLCRDSDVVLYIGHAAWREADDHQSPRWRGEMIRQLEMVASSDVAEGSVFFRHLHLMGPVGNAIRDFYFLKDSKEDDREPLFILDTLSVGTPRSNPTIAAPVEERRGFNITGTSDPNELLHVNGDLVRNRTPEGFFSIHVPVAPGENVFTFTQNGQEPVTRTITRNTPAPPPPPPTPPTITQVTDIRYATVSANETWAFPRNTTSGGTDWMLLRGQVDRVTATSTNNFVRLASGVWVSGSAVSIATYSSPIIDVLSDGEYIIGQHYDKIVWQATHFPAINPSFDGNVLTVRYGLQSEVPAITLPSNLDLTLFYEVSYGIENDIPYHAFTLRTDANLEGYFVEYEDGEFRLILKKRRSLTPGDMPLEGFTFVLDAGHGGDDIGAIGPMGIDAPEKNIVLINQEKLSERLQALGAAVYYTRTDDYTVTLSERVALSRSVKPDLFISLHINSVAETTNATNIQGFTIWYRNPNSAPFSEVVLDLMYDINPMTNRHRSINQANFYVCRPTWAPHVLFESSFIVNIDDFVWLIDPVEQNRMADASVNAILEYFS